MSPALGGVVVLGGNDLSTGEATPTLHIFRNGQGWLSPPIRGTTLGAVRAAVYSPADKNIWLVDNYETGKLRIVKLNPFTGAAQVAGTYEWDEASHVRQGMGVNPNGTVLLYTSTGSTTRVASLAVVNSRSSPPRSTRSKVGTPDLRPRPPASTASSPSTTADARRPCTVVRRSPRAPTRRSRNSSSEDVSSR